MPVKEVDPATREAYIRDARGCTSELVDDPIGEQYMGPRLPLVNRLRWEVGHVAWFHERSILQRVDGDAPLVDNGHTTMVGAQMRYCVHAHDGTRLAMLGFSTAAWTLAPRDRFIGWSRQMREKNLPRVVDNPRFLILPWIHILNLGSHILAIVHRQLPIDWTARYNTTPVLIETFVETPRYTGAVYRASGWTHVGATQGHGRYDTKNRYDKPKKGHLAVAPAQGLEAHPQPLESAGIRHRHGTSKRLLRITGHDPP